MIIIPIKKFQNPFKSLRARNQHLNFIAPQEEPKKRRYVKNWWCTCLLFEIIEKNLILKKYATIAGGGSLALFLEHFILFDRFLIFNFRFGLDTSIPLHSLFLTRAGARGCFVTPWVKLKMHLFLVFFAVFFLDNTTDSPDFFLRLLHPILVWV